MPNNDNDISETLDPLKSLYRPVDSNIMTLHNFDSGDYDSVTCLRCDAKLQKKDWATHIATARHKHLFEQEAQLVATETKFWERRNEAAGFASRIASLLRADDQDKVNVKLLQYVLNINEPRSIVEKTLKKYEHVDRVVMLLLALWKVTCLAQKPKRPLNDALDIMEWLNDGWKDLKVEMRKTNVLYIIGPLVVQFLDRSCLD